MDTWRQALIIMCAPIGVAWIAYGCGANTCIEAGTSVSTFALMVWLTGIRRKTR